MTETEPESTADQLSAALDDTYRELARDNHDGRDDPYGLTISGLTRCTKQAAYRAARIDPSDPTLAWDQGSDGRPAVLGTLLHRGLLPTLAGAFASHHVDQNVQHEYPVTLHADGHEIPGTADLVTLMLVADLKTAGAGQLGRLRSARQAHRLQVGGYALALYQEGFAVDEVAWLYHDRSDGRDKPIVEPFTAELADEVRARTFGVLDWAERPDHAPREQRGPGLSWVCDGCPWLQRCWGPRATPGRAGPQGVEARSDPEVEHALAEYARTASMVTRLNDRKKYLRSVIEGEDETGTPRRPGTYGAWTWRHGKPGTKTDQAEAVKRLEAAGIPVPEVETEGRFSVRPAD